MSTEIENPDSNACSSSPQRTRGGPLSVEVRLRETGARTVPEVEDSPSIPVPAVAIHYLVLASVLLISGIYVGAHIGGGWVPADEGALSTSALRVLHGQLPHRDFSEIYTGGLNLIHALAFRVFGVNLMSLRICVFLFFLAWVPVPYFIARRFTSAPGAGLVTLLAVSWSYPNYPAAMPSWYNLFFATFGAAAMLRYLDVRTRRWLFVAGICGGVSILIKVIGAYYIAGILLSLLFLEQGSHEPTARKGGSAGYRIFSIGGLLLFLATLVYVLHTRLGDGEIFAFILPAIMLVASMLWSERGVNAATGTRFRSLFKLAAPFVSGLCLPIALFLLPYAWSGALKTFLAGVGSSAAARAVDLGVLRPEGLKQAIYALALAGLVAAAMFLREFQGWLVGAVVGLGLAAMLLRPSPAVISGVWASAATLTPVVVIAGAAFLLASRTSSRWTTMQRQRVMVLSSLAALCSLVQYPFAAPIYLSYSIPLTLLAAVAIVGTAKKQAGTYLLAAVAAFYMLFGAITLVPGYIYELTHKVGTMSELHLERAGGLQIEYAPNYQQLIQVLQEHSGNGLLLAGNDCPELYFLSGLKNPTGNDNFLAPRDVLQVLQSTDVKVVVINEGTFFPGGQMRPEVRAEVMRRFPEQLQMGIFHIFWQP